MFSHMSIAFQRQRDSLAVCIHPRFQINSRLLTLNFTLSADDGPCGAVLFRGFDTVETTTPTAVAIFRIELYVVLPFTSRSVHEDQLDRNCVASLPLGPGWNCVSSLPLEPGWN